MLDLGCGGGALMAGAAAGGYKSMGIDVSMTWLIVAQRMVKEWGGRTDSSCCHSGIVTTARLINIQRHLF